MKTTKPRGDLGALSEALGLERWQVVALLAASGIHVDPETGEFDAARVVELLADSTPSSRANRAETIRYHREDLRAKLIQVGLEYLGDALPRGALLMFRRPDTDGQVNVLSYVAVSKNRFGQISFTANHLDDANVHWVALVAVPLERTFLFRREELEQQAKGSNSLSITIRAGTSDTNTLDRRVDELVRGTRRNAEAGGVEVDQEQEG